MSWYKRTPRLKEPPKHLPAHRSSPISDKIMEETKPKVRVSSINSASPLKEKKIKKGL
jgi:hypothetical protein